MKIHTYLLLLQNDSENENRIRENLLNTKFENATYKYAIHAIYSKPNTENPIEGCLCAHRQALLNFVRDKKKDDFPYPIIFEQDAEIANSHFSPVEIHKSLPEKWFMLYFGYNVLQGNVVKNYPHLLSLNFSVAAHAYMLNPNIIPIPQLIKLLDSDFWYDKSLYDGKVLKEKPKRILPIRAIDIFYASFMKTHPVYGIYPIIVHQRPGYSHLEKTRVDYQETMVQRSAVAFKNVEQPISISSKIIFLSDLEERVFKLAKRLPGKKVFGNMDSHIVCTTIPKIAWNHTWWHHAFQKIQFLMYRNDWEVVYLTFPDTNEKIYILHHSYYDRFSVIGIDSFTTDEKILYPTLNFVYDAIDSRFSYIFDKTERIGCYEIEQDLLYQLRTAFPKKQFVLVRNVYHPLDAFQSLIFTRGSTPWDEPFYHLNFSRFQGKLIELVPLHLSNVNSIYLENRDSCYSIVKINKEEREMLFSFIENGEKGDSR